MIPSGAMKGIGISIDRESGQSLTDQLANGLRSSIRMGRWKHGDRLPSRDELMSVCGVSRNVVESAIRRLIAEGLVVTRPRIGCTVIRASRRAVRGRVLEIDTGSGIPYWNAVFYETLRRSLSTEHIDCRNSGLSYDKHDRLSVFDRERLEYELDQHPDLVLAVTSRSRTAGLQRILDAHDVPYILAIESTRGRHPHMLWSRQGKTVVGMDSFASDCVRMKVRSVMWLAYSGKSEFDPRLELNKVGIAVETLLAQKKSSRCNFTLGEYMALGRDCILERIKKGSLCDLLFVADDYLAMGVVPALLESGVRIPEDLKFVTQCNKGFGPVLTKSLARIEVDPSGFASECARGIIEWFRTDKFPYIDVPVSVYKRGDTFPVLETL